MAKSEQFNWRQGFAPNNVQ